MTHRRFSLALATLDCFTLFAVLNVLAWLRGVVPFGDTIAWPLIAPALVMVAALYLIDGYKFRTDMIGVDYTSMHVIAFTFTIVATLLLTYVFFPDGSLLQGSRIVIILGLAMVMTLSLGYRRFAHQRYAERRGTRSVLFLGDRDSADLFKQECAKHQFAQPVIYSVIDESSSAPFLFPGEGRMRTSREVIDDIEADRLLVEAIVLKESGRNLNADLAQALTQLYFKGVPTYTLELFYQVYWRKIPLYRLNQTWLFQEGFQIAREPVFERLKRVADVGLAIFGLVLAAPLIGLGALAIKLGDGGSVIFEQNRVGRYRRIFRMYKLRTMRTAPLQSGADGRYTQSGDPRITPVGRFLRSSRIDELPQLWNVLRGDMSLIGPRAEWDKLVQDYEREIPCYHFRHLMRPGITGWAQVNYPYGANLDDTRRKLEYDLYYIRHFSFSLDASIVLKTIHIMLFGRGR